MELKIPPVLKANESLGLEVQHTDGEVTTFIGKCPFFWDHHRNLYVYSAENSSYVFLLKEVKKLEIVIFEKDEGNYVCVDLVQTFTFAPEAQRLS